MSVQIRANEISLIPIGSIKPNPKNRNLHSPEQIDALAKIIYYQGFRTPLVISKQSGLLVAGHGRLMAAKQLGLESLPVIFQDFDSEDQEYAAMVSDNAIASWAMLDMGSINADLPELGLQDIGLLGIKDFQMDPPNFDEGDAGDQSKLDEKKPIECPACGHEFTR